jgi:hypothetical protein
MKSEEKNCLIEIRNVHLHRGAKFEAGISALTKALGYDSERQQKEISPFKSVRDLEKMSKNRVERGLLDFYEAMMSQWFRLEKALPKNTFVLNNRIFIDPSNGKPLSNAKWKIIKRDILKTLNYIYAGEDERIALHALALGKILKGMPIDTAIKLGYSSIQSQIDDTLAKMNSPQWKNAKTFASQHAAELIVELPQKQFKKIHDTIQDSITNRHSTGELGERLFDNFGEMNRDWRRIAETEIANSQNNGQILTELENAEEGEVVFMRGVSATEACPWCRGEVDGRIVVVLDAPPSGGGDKVKVNGETYTAIWPNKSNYGRPRRNWWVAAGAQHPHAILPGQSITSALPSTAMKGFYEGPVVEIITESGSVLSVTENHPILTPFGFVKAKFLHEGMDILKSTDAEGMMEDINPNNYQGDILIEDFFTSAKHTSIVPPMVVPSFSECLHGDGRFMDKTIDIVNTYGLLGGDIESLLLKLNYQRLIDSVRFRFGLSADSDLLKSLYRDWFSSLRNTRLHGELLPPLRGAFGHSDFVAFRNVSEDDAVLFDKTLSEGGATHSSLSREFIYRFSSEVSFDDSLREFRGIAWESPSFLISDKIQHTETSSYSGCVYDLTDDIYGLYTCNGIVVKNCRCTWVRYIPGFESWDAKIRAAMDQAMKRGEAMQKRPDEYESTIKPVPWEE